MREINFEMEADRQTNRQNKKGHRDNVCVCERQRQTVKQAD